MTTAEQNYLLLQEIEANRRFLLMAYQQNPKLLERADARIKQMFEVATPRELDKINSAGMTRQRGISLIELIMFIVIVSIALAGIMLGMNQITSHSADTMLRKQALTAAESLLEEIEARDFSPTSAHVAVTTANRATVYHIVSDYDGFATTGIYAIDGTPVMGLNNYSLTTTTVVPPALGNISAANSVLITVTVTDPMGGTIVTSGYRTNH